MNNKKQKWICLFLFALYILVLLYLTIFRFNFYYDERQLNLTLFANLIYLFQNAGVGEFVRLFFGNICWFIPFGFLLPILMKKKSFFITVVIGMMFSFFIETMQYILFKGVAELDDLILNTFGTVIGYLLYRILQKIIIKGKPFL